jgi:cytochrome c peroxidase
LALKLQIILILGIMKKLWIIAFIVVFASSFSLRTGPVNYQGHYINSINDFDKQLLVLSDRIKSADITSPEGVNNLKSEIELARIKLKGIDFWVRYLEPVAYKKLNGPLPVEWENEVFEKYEKPYKREGAGLSLAELYLANKNITKDSLEQLVRLSVTALNTFKADSITRQLDTFDHFFLCNRLYLLNLAAIYTTGFECPDYKNIIPELRGMLQSVKQIYTGYNQSFPATPLTNDYLALYDKTIDFVNLQPADFARFDHFDFIKNYINPLFAINQELIGRYNVLSSSFNDFTLNNDCMSIFNKSLYMPQNAKGVYSLVSDKETLKEIKAVGKLLFYDPILSGNNERSCASCHKPTEYFTDTAAVTSLQFGGKSRLARNTPTLINVVYNHLLMLDGKHISLQSQGKDVMTNPLEMGCSEEDILKKIMSCKEYRSAFKKFLKATPENKEITFDYIASAITYFYTDFSNYYSPFDNAMNNNAPLGKDAVAGFNLFMSKAQCATCHYVPQFNGVPPPYISSEFEVLGIPDDTTYSKLNADKGRYNVNPAFETNGAFRTGSLRNSEYTKPYMHNGVFSSLRQVIDFYDAGGGAGRKLDINNQTLSSDSLRLTQGEKNDLISFIHSLNEDIIFEGTPQKLPSSSDEKLNERKVGGTY